jgi:hypothetical protein
MKCTSLYGMFIILAAILFSPSSFSQNNTSGGTPMPSEAEMMARWKDFMTPGDMHKKLAMFAGTWNVESKVWMKGLDGPPSVSKGTSKKSLVYDGRYLKEELNGEMMEQPFLGTGYTAYDNMKKKFVATWIDNMGTAISTMEGTMDESGKVLTLTGKMDEPMTGEKDKEVKYVLRVIDKNKHIFESYDIAAYGADRPVMQITYTRKK